MAALCAGKKASLAAGQQKRICRTDLEDELSAQRDLPVVAGIEAVIEK